MTGKFLIYLLCEMDGSPRYVGQSRRGMLRPNMHRHAAFMKRRDGSWYYDFYLYRWLRDLLGTGGDFKIEIAEVLDSADDLDAAERRWIGKLRASGTRLVNETPGGQGGRPSAESIARMAAKARVRWATDSWFRGRITAGLTAYRASPEGRAAMSERARLQWADPAARKAMSEIKLRCTSDPLVRQRLSRSHGGRPVLDDLGNMYFSAAEAARQLGVTPGAVCMALNGKRRVCVGRRLRYADIGAENAAV